MSQDHLVSSHSALLLVILPRVESFLIGGPSLWRILCFSAVKHVPSFLTLFLTRAKWVLSEFGFGHRWRDKLTTSLIGDIFRVQVESSPPPSLKCLLRLAM